MNENLPLLHTIAAKEESKTSIISRLLAMAGPLLRDLMLKESPRSSLEVFTAGIRSYVNETLVLRSKKAGGLPLLKLYPDRLKGMQFFRGFTAFAIIHGPIEAYVVAISLFLRLPSKSNCDKHTIVFSLSPSIPSLLLYFRH